MTLLTGTDNRWFVIHLRNGKDVLAQGEAERDRIMCRKTPKAVSSSVAKIHQCSVCHARGPWTEKWSWWGSYKDIDEGRPVKKFCSRDCRLKHSAKRPEQEAELTWEERADLQRYQPQKQKERSAAFMSRLDRERAMKAHRTFEMPNHPRIADLGKKEGQCRWCGERITGPHAQQRSWHRAERGERGCFTEWQLHTDAEAQYWFLMRRDGPGCADCGRGDGKWVPVDTYSLSNGVSWTAIAWSVKLEVDHDMPLYLKALLDDLEERRALHHPLNLKLRCVPCHKRKCAAEAIDRARRR